MPLKGIAIGGFLGGIIGRGLWGVLFGALIGYQIHQRVLAGRRHGTNVGAGSPRRGQDPLPQAYKILGAKPSDSSSELVRKYRALAKRHHPDALRAQSRPEAEIAAATEYMSRINAAWSKVRAARGI